MVTRARWLVAAAAAASLAYGALACTSDGGGGGSSCPSDLPASCPEPPPSYASDVAPVIARRCTGCHSPTGVEAERDFTSYERVHELRADVLSQVYACRMPPADAAAPTPAERATLLAWLVCGAPNN